MEVFDKYSLYYDLLYQDKDYHNEANYIHQLIQTEKPGASSILNFGCGTGKHDILLAKIGYEVTGVDVSGKMIKFAKSNSTNQKNLDFFRSDIRTVKFDKKFDVIISLFHVMNYQLTNNDLISTFNNAKKHLKENGVFIFDCWYGPGVLKDPPKFVTKEVENEELLIKRKTKPSTNINKNIVEVLFEIEIFDKKENKIYRIKENHKMRYLFAPEINIIGKISGFNEYKFSKWMSNKLPSLKDWYTINILK